VPSSHDFRIRAARLARRSLGIASYTVGAAAGVPYARLLGLRSAAERALAWGDLNDAEGLARQLLELAERFRDNWYYGNAIHHAHMVLGSVELARGNLAAAELSLIEAGRTPGSPQLNSFGPSMELAEKLIEMGRSECVLEYLGHCRAFWCPDGRDTPTASRARRTLDTWIAQIREGQAPDFGPNLLY
jgi:hypothetical protein